jgi:hypothetical protein
MVINLDILLIFLGKNVTVVWSGKTNSNTGLETIGF